VKRAVLVGLVTLLSTGAAAADKARTKRFYLRLGVVHIAPLSTSDELELADVDGPASLAIQNGPIEGSGAVVGDATIPGLVVGYTLPVLGDRLGIETVLGLPFTVEFKATGTLRDESLAPMALGIPTGVPALGEDLGKVKAVPPVVTAVYSFTRPGARVRPFVGAGVAVLFSLDGEATNPILTEVSQPEFEIPPAPGLALQAGLEAKLWRSIYARLDVKFIAFMEANATMSHIQVRTPEIPLFDTAEIGTAKMSVMVNPLIVQAGIGMDF
jgi:outer membrane protein W